VGWRDLVPEAGLDSTRATIYADWRKLTALSVPTVLY
jgi:hypothetical protein